MAEQRGLTPRRVTYDSVLEVRNQSLKESVVFLLQ